VAQNKRQKRRKFSMIYLVIWLVLIGLGGAFFITQITRYNELSATLSQTNANLERERSINQDLYIQREFFDSDAYIERIARERLGMVRPNEIVFRNTAAD